jgi:hypothetical protein
MDRGAAAARPTRAEAYRRKDAEGKTSAHLVNDMTSSKRHA